MTKRHTFVLGLSGAIGLMTLWILSAQRARIDSAETRNEDWRALINRETVDESHVNPARLGDPLDWKIYSGKSGLWMGDYEGMQIRTRLQKRLHQLDKDQLCAALDGILASDIHPWAIDSLAWMTVEVLIEHDPELVLKKYGALLKDEDGEPLYPVAIAIKKWARNDPAAAIDWYETMARDGLFWGKELHQVEPAQIRFELQLISGLLDADPAAAKQRMKNIKAMMSPHDLGKGIDVDEVDTRNFAAMIRSAYEDPKDQMSAIISAGSELTGRDGYAAITKYMDEVDATSEERIKLVEMAARYTEIRSLQDVQKARQWVGVHAPEQVDEITGQMILRATSGSVRQRAMSFQQASELAVGYKSDKVLSAFLISHEARANRELSRTLAEKIADEKLRGEVLNYLR